MDSISTVTSSNTAGTRPRHVRRLVHSALVLGIALAAIVETAAPRIALGAPSRPAGVIVTGRGDAAGYHLYLARAGMGWRWRPLATIDPGARSEESWIGYQCVTAAGRFAAVVTAPRHAANDPVLRQRGAYAYSVDLQTGRVRPLATGVALMYFNPGCGQGNEVALSRYLGDEQQQTEVQVMDLATGTTLNHATYTGELTSATPTRDGVLAALGAHLTRLRPHAVERIATLPGIPFELRSTAKGAAFLVATRTGKALADTVIGTTVRGYGWAQLAGSDLFPTRDGRAVLTTSRGHVAGAIREIPDGGTAAETVSTDGDVLLSGTPAAALAHSAGVGPAVEAAVTLREASGRIVSRSVLHGSGPTVTALPGESSSAARARAAINTTTPTCAVPRLDPSRQVLQPNAPEVDWAVQQATRGNLKGTVLTRPKNYANMGFAAYSPSADLPPPTLSGYPGVPIPRSVIEAILAQESNFDQASFHALPGVGGDPLIADYYGAQGSISQINYELSDCGYGIGQITSGMKVAETTPYSEEEKAKIAVDYAENIAASIQDLGSSWNTLAANGITLNGGNPTYLENWYFATWAYNTGFHANTGSGPWGLGWTNNPQNSSYPPNRTPFLRASYEDAAHPANWPYQERIIGWMETPLLNYRGQRSYLPATGPNNSHFLHIPGFSTFCTASNNCSPSYKNPEGNHSLDYCELSNRECWWHLPVTYTECPSLCATSSFTTSSTATEPADDPTYLPDCESVLPTNAIIVDDEPKDLNVRGCAPTTWKSKGTFKVKYGVNASKVPVGEIDWHQLGTGFGGHLFFTHNRPAADAEHIETGTWTPGTLTAGIYAIQAHIPVNGATTTEATYRIYPGDGTSKTITINQHVGGNQWVPLGDFNLLSAGAKVVLTNVTNEPSGTKDVAYDAIAFTFIAKAANQEQNLALRFEPVLRFDTSEKWRPLNLTAFFGETESKGLPAQHRCIPYESPDAESTLGERAPYKETPEDYRTRMPAGETTVEVDVARCQTVSSIEAATAWRSPDAYIDIGPLGHSDEVTSYHSPYPICLHNELLDCNGNEQANDPYSAMYYYLTDASGYQFIQYWQYYRYNSFSDAFSAEGSHHEGDWEAVAISPSLDGSHFEFASFSQHGKWYSYLRSAMKCADQPGESCGTDTTPQGRRAVDFVANGDHANFATACSETSSIPPYECGRGDGNSIGDRGHDGKYTWGHAFDGQGLFPMPTLGTGSWSDWPGHWGATPPDVSSPWIQPGYASPRSPGSQAMFAKPWGTCGKDLANNTCAVPARSATAPVASAATLVKLARTCDTWFGGDVAAMACDPRELAKSVADRRLDRPGAVSLKVRRATAAGRASRMGYGSTQGLAQAVGGPLDTGDKIVLAGRTGETTALAVRVVAHGHAKMASLTLPSSSHGLTVEVAERGGRQRLRILK